MKRNLINRSVIEDSQAKSEQSIARRKLVAIARRVARKNADCLEELKRMGGPAAAKKRLRSLQGREAKIRFLKSFPGIGDKYARNIMMDVYHEDFRDSIAVDVRIKKVSAAHGLSFGAYADEQLRAE